MQKKGMDKGKSKLATMRLDGLSNKEEKRRDKRKAFTTNEPPGCQKLYTEGKLRTRKGNAEETPYNKRTGDLPLQRKDARGGTQGNSAPGA